MSETSIKKEDSLFNELSKNYSDKDRITLKKAYDLASEGHSDQKRHSGEPYITHPLHVALYLSNLIICGTFFIYIFIIIFQKF